MTWLRQIPGVREIEFNGETLPRTSDLIIGTGLAASYDPATRKTTLETNASGLPAGTATYQPLTWNGSAWVGAALNLAQAAAVTGVLGVANGGVPVPANPADDAKVLTASGGTYTWTVAPTGLPALGAANTVLRVNAGGVAVEYAKLTTANLDAAAGIVGTQLAAGANILGSQLSAAAAIAATQLAAGAAGTVLIGGASNSFSAAPTVTSLAASSYLAAGGTVATAGALRLAHGASVQGRDVGNAADRVVASWGVVANDTVNLGDANVVTRVTGSALHAYAGATQVAQLGLATSDYLKLGATPSTAGHLRLGHAVSAQGRNNTNTGDIRVWDHGVTVANCATFGSEDNSQTYLRASSFLTFIVNNANSLQIGTSQFYVTIPDWRWASTVSSPRVFQDPRGSDLAGQDLVVRAQSAYSSAVTNVHGAHLLLQGGAEKGAAAGKKGGVRLQLNGTTETMIEATEIAIGRRVVALCRGSDLTTTQMPANSGDRVVYGATAATIPAAAPVDGGIHYWDSDGNAWGVNEAGVHTQLTP